MAYSLELTPLFQSDFSDAVRYIRDALRNPIAAGRLVSAFDEAVESVLLFPASSKPILAGTPQEAYYSVKVKNYLAFYVVNGNVLEFRRFLYARSDVLQKLE